MNPTVLQATVMRSVRFKESSLILTLFSPAQGYVTATCRGALRPRSPLRAATELFVSGNYTLQGRPEHYIVSACDITDAHYALRENLENLSCAVYLRDFCDAVVTEEQENAALYRLLSVSLNALCHEGTDYQAVKTFFEVHAMALAGFSPALEGCALCGKEASTFSPSAGGLVCSRCAGEYPDVSPILPGTVSYLLRLSRWDARALHVLRSQKKIEGDLERNWEPYIAYYLEKKFRFTPFMDKIGKFTENDNAF